MQELRDEEIGNTDTAEAMRIFTGCTLQAAAQNSPPPTSGLIEQQFWFMKLHPKHSEPRRALTNPVMITRLTVCIFSFALAVALSFARAEESAKERAPISINVLGQVNQQAKVSLPSGANILDALAAAGGATKNANLSKVLIIHRQTEGTDRVEINVKRILTGEADNFPLRDGDTINVPVRLVQF